MGSWDELYEELKAFYDNVYLQPPSNITLKYPCVVVNKDSKDNRYGNNSIYYERQRYKLTSIGLDPTSEIPNQMERYFTYCKIDNHFTMDNVNQTVLTLHY